MENPWFRWENDLQMVDLTPEFGHVKQEAKPELGGKPELIFFPTASAFFS